MKKKIEAEMKVDETVYEYDEVWDKMQEAKLRQKEKKEVESKERKVSPLHTSSCLIVILNWNISAKIYKWSLTNGYNEKTRPLAS